MKKTIGNKKTFAVVSSLGGIVTKFVWNGSPIIYPERAVGEKSRGGIPVCFPFFGKSEEFYEIPKHGWLRNEELTLVHEAEMCVVFYGRRKADRWYPWSLEYEISVSIDPALGLTIRLFSKRLHDGNHLTAPINPGFHPYFLSDSSENHFVKCMARVGSKVVTDFCKESNKIIVADPILVKSGEKTVKIILGEAFSSDSCLTLWSDDPDKYFCVEPVLTHPSKFFGHSDKGKFLRPNEIIEMACALRVV